MAHFKAIIEYDGTDFAGFQWQLGQRTVQSAVEGAIETRTGKPIRISGAGRTDAGVHAIGQVVSFSVETSIPAERMALALNSALPMDVRVREVEEVGEDFHARHSASSRAYGYLILNTTRPAPLLRRYTASWPQPLDIASMRAAAGYLKGERDFAAFANELRDDQSPCREVRRIHCRRRGRFVFVAVEANAFLRGMVRTIVGTLMYVGSGRMPVASIPDILNSRDRALAGPTAPPHGLYLLRVRYGTRRHNAWRHST